METVTLTYASGATTQNFQVLAIRGHDDYDEVEFHNSFSNTTDDGVVFENVDSVRKIVTIDFPVIPLQADRTFIINWLLDRTRTINYAGTDMAVALYDSNGFASEWIENIKFSKKFTLKFKQRNTSITNNMAVGYGGSVAQFNGRANRNVAVTGGVNNTITFSSALSTTPIVICTVLDAYGSIVADETSIVSISTTGFVINPIASGLLTYFAIIPT